MNRLKKTYEKRNATQPKMNHKSHIQHIQTLTNEMEQLRKGNTDWPNDSSLNSRSLTNCATARASLKKQTKVAWLLW